MVMPRAGVPLTVIDILLLKTYRRGFEAVGLAGCHLAGILRCDALEMAACTFECMLL